MFNFGDNDNSDEDSSGSGNSGSGNSGSGNSGSGNDTDEAFVCLFTLEQWYSTLGMRTHFRGT